MKKILPLIISFAALSANSLSAANSITLLSPDGKIAVDFLLSSEGTPQYSVKFKGNDVILPSTMGFKFKNFNALSGFKIKDISTDEVREQWTPVWGENETIDNNYNSMAVTLEMPDKEQKFIMKLDFRAYDDGVGYRYSFPETDGDSLVIIEELSTFAMPSDMTAWWIPGDYDTQEYQYNRSRLSEIEGWWSDPSHIKASNVSQKGFAPGGVQTSLMLKSDDGLYVNLHEAALIDYPAMHLLIDTPTLTFTSWLTPDPAGYKATVKLPFSTPWRTIMVSDKATDILSSNLIYNLNDPCALEDTSWIHPTKYMGVWWEMITGKSSWAYTSTENFDLSTFDYSKAKPNGIHGANNENVKRYIDFAAENGFDQLLVEGWNIGWEDWFGKEKEYVFDFVTPYPDFDLKGLNDYARSKGIKLMMHHETSGSIPNYEAHIDTAYNLMNQYGYDAVKSGYVGNILPKGEYHYGQYAVNHYLNAIKKAAEHRIMVNAHEAVRPTGLARTYPNLVGNESALGTEYREMEPGHEAILPFTRLKGGPMDFTPGIFRMDIDSFVPGAKDRKKATVANQLALYVTMYSPLQMAADMPEHYSEKPDAFTFIRDVPVDWRKSLYLDAEPSEYIVSARLDKNSDAWYVGGITDETPRHYDLKLSFLEAGRTYDATLYSDAADAHYLNNPESYEIKTLKVKKDDVIHVNMAPGGGFALSLKPDEK